MNKMQLQVQEFHETFDVPVEKKPCIPSLEIRKLRAKLILEEAFELVKALGVEAYSEGGDFVVYSEFLTIQESQNTPDLMKIADGIADLQYVNLGTAVACGIDIEPIYDEVHRSNMSKAWTPEDIMLKFNKAQYSKILKGKLNVVKDQAGKVIKSPTYSPANLKPILAAQSL